MPGGGTTTNGASRLFFGNGTAGVITDSVNTTRQGILECTTYTLNPGVTVSPVLTGTPLFSLTIFATKSITIHGTLAFGGVVLTTYSNPFGTIGVTGGSPTGATGPAGAGTYAQMQQFIPSNSPGAAGGTGGNAGIANAGGGSGGSACQKGGDGGNGSGILGGGGAGSAGQGGGNIILVAPIIIFGSGSSVDAGGMGGGGQGGGGGGGGGAGGTIILAYQQCVNRVSASLNVTGGNGGVGGGGAVGGAGGTAGQAGGNGANGVNGGGAGGGGAGGTLVELKLN